MGTKRKERDGEEPKAANEEHHGSTLFITSLPYTYTSTDLQTLFSDHAPVRKAFVVLDKETKVSKGVGYVTFAVREDAERLVEELSAGLEVGGRKVRVQWPGTKPDQPKPDTPSKPKPTPKRTLKPLPTPKDPNAIRTIVITGLPTGITNKEIWKKVRKQAGAEKVIFPVYASSAAAAAAAQAEGAAEGEEGDGRDVVEGTAHVLFDTPAHAQSAVQALHAHTFKGSLLSVVLKKRLDASLKIVPPIVPASNAEDASAAAGTAGQGVGKAKPNRAGRLIVRNLPFHITERDLREAFLPYGPIYSIEIPTLPSPSPASQSSAAANADESKGKEKKRKPKIRGFAFVWMLSKSDAQRAIEGVNGKVLGKKEGKEGRVVAVDWALSKERWEREVAEVGEGDEGVEEEGQEDAAEGEGERWGDVEMGDAEAEDAESAEDDEEEDGDDDEDEEEDEEVDDDDEESAGNSEDEEGNEDEEDEDEDGPKTRPTLPQTDVGTTLFVRNIPFEATEDDLRTTFRAFGPLRYARITLDPITGRSRGTGFVCFWQKEHADLAIREAEQLASETGLSSSLPGAGEKKKEKRQNPFAVQSLLTPDPSSGLASRLVLHGRTLSVARAVPRDEAARLKEEGEKRREKEDKRNLYLMREGVIFPNTPAAATIPPAELDRRVASFNTRRTLLRSNPSLYISKTRLSVRQIPTFATDRTLKRLAIHAVRTFEDEVKRGEREGLTSDELGDDTPPSSGPAKKKQKGERQTAVVQSKIVRQAERVDPLSGKGKSKGYGFLEMRSHADALRVLRWANNNPDVVPLMSGWWKTELLDTLKKLDEQLKTEKEREKKEELNDRIRKIRARVKLIQEAEERGQTAAAADGEEGKGGRGREGGGRGLILEFSIENVQVVKRRKELVEGSRERAKRRQTESEAGDAAEERPRKRQKIGKGAPKQSRDDDAPPRGKGRPSDRKEKSKGEAVAQNGKPARDTSLGKNLGALIGKKRKERKGKRGGKA